MIRTTLTTAPPLRHNADFRLLLSGRVISQLGDQLQFLALPLLTISLTGSATQAGLILGTQTAVYLLFGLTAGALADRLDRKATMLWCEVARAVLIASIPAADLLHVLAVPQLYLVAIATGALGTLFGAANGAALPHIVRPVDLPRALGAVSAAGSALRLLGAPVAGFAYAAGRTLPMGINAVSFLVSAACLRGIRAGFQQETHTPPSTTDVLRDIRAGLRWVWSKPVIRVLALLDAGDSLRFGAGYLLIITLATRLHASTIEIGTVFAGAAGGGLIGGLAAPWLARRVALGSLSIVMLWAEALTFPLYALTSTWWLLLAVAFAESVLTPVYTVALDTYRIAITPDVLRGRAGAAVSTLTTSTAAIGAMASGAVITAIGAAPFTWLLAALLGGLALTATCSPTVRSARNPGMDR